jgi:hypothetical protein
VLQTGAEAAALATADWPGGPQLAVATAQTPVTAGGALVVQMNWIESDAPRKASLQLLRADGSLLAQEDRDIVAGGQDYVLLIPRSAAAGDYRLALVVYDPATGARFPTASGAELVALGTVAIDAAPVAVPTALPPLRHPTDAADEGS